MLRPAFVLALAWAALGTAGCARFREISACRAVVREVNGAMDEVQKLAEASPVDEPRIARRYGDLAKALLPYSQGEAPLAVAVREYAAVVESTRAAVEAHAVAASTKGRTPEARRELDKVTKRERVAASRIENECLH
ncbi:MAG: hypothetical protein EOO73_24810 [Myxococcales bacterium]|nr:MAG: hypothetical protein EOO73_24810 [Myxococcales bacterium]